MSRRTCWNVGASIYRRLPDKWPTLGLRGSWHYVVRPVEAGSCVSEGGAQAQNLAQAGSGSVGGKQNIAEFRKLLATEIGAEPGRQDAPLPGAYAQPCDPARSAPLSVTR